MIFFNIKVDDNPDISTEIVSGGGGDKDREHILRYLNNNHNRYLKSVNSSNGINYVFQVDYSNNPKEQFNSKYIASGFYSTAIAITLLKPESELRNYSDKLVFKTLGVNKFKKDKQLNAKYFDDWNERYYRMYELLKKTFNNLLLTIYFYGNQIYNDKLLLNIDDIETDEIKKKEYYDFISKKRLSFNISKFYEPIETKPLINKQIYLIKIICVLNHLSKLGYLISDFKIDNVRTDNDNNFVLIDFAFHLLFQFRIGSNYNIGIDMDFGSFISCFVMKNLFKSFEQEIDTIHELIEYRKNNLHNDEFKNYIHPFFGRYPNGRTLSRYRDIYLTENNVENMLVTNVIKTNIKSNNIGYEKINSFGLVDIIINLFFSVFYEDSEKKVKGSLKSFLQCKNIINNNNVRLESNKSLFPYVFK